MQHFTEEGEVAAHPISKGARSSLTAHGRSRAVEMIRHRRLLELYLHQELGYPLGEVHPDAETLEHAISGTLEDRIAAKLGHPTVDRHGHPIPRKDGRIGAAQQQSLVELDVGAAATVVSVSDRDQQMLRYM